MLTLSLPPLLPPKNDFQAKTTILYHNGILCQYKNEIVKVIFPKIRIEQS
jgi:hypothetical protein